MISKTWMISKIELSINLNSEVNTRYYGYSVRTSIMSPKNVQDITNMAGEIVTHGSARMSIIESKRISLYDGEIPKATDHITFSFI